MPKLSRDMGFFKETQELYDQIAPEFNRSRGKEPWHPLIQFLALDVVTVEIAAKHDSSTIMDLGCGNGRNLLFLSKTFPSAICTGLDISSTLLLAARQVTKDLPRISLVQGSMTDLPFRNSSHDVIACVAALHHSPSKASIAATLEQARSVLKASGLLILSTWRKWQPRFRWQVIKNGVLLKRQPGLVKVPWKGSKDGITRQRKYFLVSLSEAKRLLRKWFTVIDVKTLGGPGNNDNLFILARAGIGHD